ncbi:MAG: aminotransferase class III-fold pyridoxal phosphate-dependent enzyme [Tabrizicola sp.]|uniref:aspartate aminotransferase family protein n=1 Tax=Tabrizicola sp. TaxID=2005166 RepID=UPI002732E907|nr:aminotransferase class III-fold pyridoxal phosphate-dependent enzyme [Tabrizicola sp.]MDP3262819.1 aminotransferase class III-fold pyridoxal phosphate-dependent enzyme [Tabrizicola sp.]MDP3649016.1 aminotransferase class III-fold pyridoxal phosphate-dependent enzyme [Paracoccaceae bacterium]MDZ4068710.1 aminotransferase class III-fold pyridoxal phosphate-dependent enzyme [Tabrizicola sp.]
MTRQTTMINGYTPGNGSLAPEDQARIARRAALLGPAYRLFYETPVHLVRGEGVWLYDRDGNAYLDTYNNVASVGHCHPRVVAAMADQAATLATHTRYLHDAVLDYAERLLAHFPAPLTHVMFTCTGSEANDLALRIARAKTGGTGIVVTDNAYHGVTLATAEMSMSIGPAVAPGPTVFPILAPTAANYPGDLGLGFAAAVTAACERMAAQGIKPCALIVDTIFSSDAVLPGPAGFLGPAAAAIRAAGGLFIADEVQPGFGRTGSQMWGFQRHGLIPDMVSLGKPMGNGYPMAGLVVQPEIVADFGAKSRYFNTFGGNAVAASVGMAVLNVIRDEGLQANALHTGRAFHDGLKALAARHPCLGDVRSAGLFLGQDIIDATGAPDPTTAARIVNALREARVLISATGPRGHILKIRPPMVFTSDHVAIFLDRLETVLQRL